ncbi:hypothetical protein PIB30_035181 [Stylosanthes scabra]|uniref:Uncharacterized protein n=1 Tax=Stylosanthes scabra TaxID=79078 RepID=A0ABU6ZBF6_9FABA|nr:hypothetical protein [Stylosanthes scabra]
MGMWMWVRLLSSHSGFLLSSPVLLKITRCLLQYFINRKAILFEEEQQLEEEYQKTRWEKKSNMKKKGCSVAAAAISRHVSHPSPNFIFTATISPPPSSPHCHRHCHCPPPLRIPMVDASLPLRIAMWLIPWPSNSHRKISRKGSQL